MANLDRLVLAFAAAALIAPGHARAGTGVIVKHTVSVYADDHGGALKGPTDVACSEAGALIVADTANHRLVSFTLKGQAVLGGREIKIASLQWPVGVLLDPKGGIVALDGKTHAIVRADDQGGDASVLELKGASDLGPVVPAAIELDRAGTLYVLDGAGKAVLVADGTGAVTRRIPLPSGKGPFTDVAADPAGTVYVVDPVAGAVWAAAKDAAEFRLLTATLKESTDFPAAISTDGLGNLFVVDRNGGTIVQLGTDGSHRARHLKLGWGEGELYYPMQICVGSDVLVVADRSNKRVQVFSVVR